MVITLDQDGMTYTGNSKKVLDAALIAAWKKDLSEGRTGDEGVEEYLDAYHAQLSEADKEKFNIDAVKAEIGKSYQKGKAKYREENVFGVGKDIGEMFSTASAKLSQAVGLDKAAKSAKSYGFWALRKIGVFSGKEKTLDDMQARLDIEASKSPKNNQYKTLIDKCHTKTGEEVLTPKQPKQKKSAEDIKREEIEAARLEKEIEAERKKLQQQKEAEAKLQQAKVKEVQKEREAQESAKNLAKKMANEGVTVQENSVGTTEPTRTEAKKDKGMFHKLKKMMR